MYDHCKTLYDVCKTSDICTTPMICVRLLIIASSLKQQSAGRHAAQLKTHYPDSEAPVFILTP